MNDEEAVAPACKLRAPDQYDVPIDPMDLLQCDSCQRVPTRKNGIGWDFCV